MRFLFQLATELAPYMLSATLAYLSLRSEKRGFTGSLWKLVCIAPLLALVYLRVFLVRVDIPEHLLRNRYGVDPDFLDSATVRSLLELTRRNKLPSNNRDTQFYSRKVEHEHIGEATPLSPQGDCSHHMLLVPNTDNTSCVLPGRVDVARHFLMSGGIAGRKERVQTGISRLLSFGRYMFNLKDYPVAKDLFQSPKFGAAARKICPPEKQYLDPVQFNFIVQVPGQAVATHLDGVYFHGATRFQFPQWLLAAMKFSKMWEEDFVDQVQVVAYYHEWKDEDHARGGQFVLWDDNGPPKYIHAASGTGTMVDGSKSVHTSSVYWPTHPAGPPPAIDKEKDVFLKFRGGDDGDANAMMWDIEQQGEVLRSYSESDIRFALVYRARCFHDAAEAAKYAKVVDGTAPEEDMMRLPDILQRFQEDMVVRGAWSGPVPAGDPAGMLKFATTILDTYVKYPLPTDVLVPYNYCALGRLVPALEPVMDLFC